MQENRPLVSIGIASYNNSQFILKTLESINSQDYPAIELIIVDDCSSDESQKVIENWIPHSRFPVKFIVNEVNQGVPHVCNIFLREASPASKYMCVFNSDDTFMDGRIRRQVETLEHADHIVAGTYGDAEIIDREDKKICDSYYEMMERNFQFHDELFKSDTNHILAEIISHNRVPAISMFYRMEPIRKMGGWNEKYSIEDLYLNLRLLNLGYKFIPVPEKLSKHRKHSTSITTVKKPVYLTSILDIVSEYKGISPEIDKSINKNYQEYALAIYQRGGKNAAGYLLQKYKFHKTALNYIMYLFARLRIPFSWIRPLYSAFSRNKPL